MKTTLLFSILLSTCALAGIQDKLLGSWDIDIEACKKNDPELRKEIEEMDREDLEAFSKIALAFGKELLAIRGMDSYEPDLCVPHSYKATKQNDKFLTLVSQTLEDTIDGEDDYDVGYVMTLLDEDHMSLKGDDRQIYLKRAKAPLKFPDPRLAKAIADGDIKRVKDCLDQGGDANAYVTYHLTSGLPLAVAVKYLNLEAAKLLIERGADVNRTDEGKSILMEAVDERARMNAQIGGEDIPQNREKLNVGIVELLLDKGAEINAIWEREMPGWPDHCLTALEIANSDRPTGATLAPYRRSAKTKAELIALLTKSGAKTYEQLSPHSDIKNKILGDWEIDLEKTRNDPAREEDPASQEELDRFPLMKMTINPTRIVTKNVISYRTYKEGTPPPTGIGLSYEVVRFAENEVVMYTASVAPLSNLSIDSPNFIKLVIVDEKHISLFMENEPPLHFKRTTFKDKLVYDDGDIGEVASSGNLEKLKLLLEHGASPNSEMGARGNSDPATPLQYAALVHDIEAVKLLLAHGADVNYRHNKGEGCTALMCAVNALSRYTHEDPEVIPKDRKKNYVDLVKLLIDKGAEVNVIIRGRARALIINPGNDDYDEDSITFMSALDFAEAQKPKEAVYKTSAKSDAQVIELLKKNGAKTAEEIRR